MRTTILMSLLTTARRYSGAFDHQPTVQVDARIRTQAAMGLWRALDRLGLPHVVERLCDLGARETRVNQAFHYPFAGSEETGGYLGGGRFRFLNEEFDVGDPIDWGLAGRSLLWRFHLHYFDWAPRLAEEGRVEELSRQIDSWIARNPVGLQPAWHPFPASLRIVNWVRVFHQMGAPGPRGIWVTSLRRQAAFLEGHLEVQLGANHLIENAFGLLVAGLFFDGPVARRWFALGAGLLADELDKQVLPDGGHCERSLSYHLRVHLVCLEAMALLKANGRPVPPALSGVHERMSEFTAGMRHLDGNVPLFHDSQLIEEPTWKRFRALSDATAPSA